MKKNENYKLWKEAKGHRHSCFECPPRKEHKLAEGVFSNPSRAFKVTVTKKEQELEKRKHDDCLVQDVKVVIHNNYGREKTVPVTELSGRKDYELVSTLRACKV